MGWRRVEPLSNPLYRLLVKSEGVPHSRIQWCGRVARNSADGSAAHASALGCTPIPFTRGRSNRPLTCSPSCGRPTSTTGYESGAPPLTSQSLCGIYWLPPPVATPKVELLWSRVHQLRNEMLLQMPDVLLLPVASIGAPLLTDREFTVNGRSLGPWEIL